MTETDTNGNETAAGCPSPVSNSNRDIKVSNLGGVHVVAWDDDEQYANSPDAGNATNNLTTYKTREGATLRASAPSSQAPDLSRPDTGSCNGEDTIDA